MGTCARLYSTVGNSAIVGRKCRMNVRLRVVAACRSSRGRLVPLPPEIDPRDVTQHRKIWTPITPLRQGHHVVHAVIPRHVIRRGCDRGHPRVYPVRRTRAALITVRDESTATSKHVSSIFFRIRARDL